MQTALAAFRSLERKAFLYGRPWKLFFAYPVKFYEVRPCFSSF